MFGGGTNEPIRTNGVPVLVVQAKVWRESPAAPQSFHARSTWPCSGPTRNDALLVAVPSGVVTVMRLVWTPVGAVAPITESEATLKLASRVPNRTDVAPVRYRPKIVTGVPSPPSSGVNESIRGVGDSGLPCQ